MTVSPNWDALVAIIIPNTISWACIFATVGQISNKDGTAWYQVLKKPTWTVPPLVYGPFFAYMYSCMGYASYLVYTESSGLTDKNELIPTVVYVAFLLLTVVIANLFYKYHKLALTFYLTMVLNGLLLAITVSFYQINTYSGIFLIPITAWQFYATLLSYAFWVLNTKQADDCQTLKA